ncbi:MAG: UDP-N-acetylmuramate dehydrogenase [Alphaproteobacteria bacterium]|nr:UDP-N-acetylmuramate dehydrogenase [Alphaproteobacteria bacterium]
MTVSVEHTNQNLQSRLPKLRGKLRAGAELAKTNWFGVGGKAELLFRPADEADLMFFMQHKPADVPITVLGVGSNVIVRDGGLQGVVIRLGGAFVSTKVDGDVIHCGAGALDVNVAQMAQQHNLTGLEFLSGIPGTIGGALRMNAGAYGREMKDVLLEARAIDQDGKLHVLKPGDMQYSYRHCAGIPENWIFTGCSLKAAQGEAQEIAAQMQKIAQERGASQPIKSRTGGSTFKNPQDQKAWQLVDAAGCRGLTIGGAQMSELHCNFMINTGDATAKDLETLGETVRERVKQQSGVALQWEIRRIGKEA